MVAGWRFSEVRPSTDSTPASIWVMNLLSGGERELVLPKGAGRPSRCRVGARRQVVDRLRLEGPLSVQCPAG